MDGEEIPSIGQDMQPRLPEADVVMLARGQELHPGCAGLHLRIFTVGEKLRKEHPF